MQACSQSYSAVFLQQFTGNKTSPDDSPFPTKACLQGWWDELLLKISISGIWVSRIPTRLWPHWGLPLVGMGFQIGLGQHGGGEENCWLCSAESSCCWDTAPLGSPAAAAQHQAEQGCSCCPSMGSWLWSLTRRRKRGLTWIRGSRGAMGCQQDEAQCWNAAEIPLVQFWGPLRMGCGLEARRFGFYPRVTTEEPSKPC